MASSPISDARYTPKGIYILQTSEAFKIFMIEKRNPINLMSLYLNRTRIP